MVEVKNLVKNYGGKEALKNISFSVKEGEVLGFLGPNGAGKSTTMNIITGYLSSNSGTVTIDGNEILENPIKAKSKIGYLPETPPLYPDMTVKSYLSFMFDLKKVKLPKEEHIKNVCTLVKISDVYDRVIKNLSKGYKQRVGLAQALLGDPPVLILDEPTVGLDPKQIIEIRTLIKNLGKKHTIILSSHVLPEIQAICDRIVVINNGSIIADDTTSNLAGNINKNYRLILQVEGDREKVRPVLTSIEKIKKVSNGRKVEPGIFEYTIETDKSVETRREIFNSLANASFPILLMKNFETNLEDIFLKLTKETTTLNEKEPKLSDSTSNTNEEEKNECNN
ncbi:MAG: Linearmycin resistance ATP-binding protein LnrL [Eubacteriales bacterium SKADARSKE-1]|nr:Linearmycin resistance ATP-binding protein LnrL [Eubacteriales bacterium SKADARSKE-1]